jgi:hypothetical protein
VGRDPRARADPGRGGERARRRRALAGGLAGWRGLAGCRGLAGWSCPARGGSAHPCGSSCNVLEIPLRRGGVQTAAGRIHRPSRESLVGGRRASSPRHVQALVRSSKVFWSAAVWMTRHCAGKSGGVAHHAHLSVHDAPLAPRGTRRGAPCTRIRIAPSGRMRHPGFRHTRRASPIDRAEMRAMRDLSTIRRAGEFECAKRRHRKEVHRPRAGWPPGGRPMTRPARSSHRPHGHRADPHGHRVDNRTARPSRRQPNRTAIASTTEPHAHRADLAAHRADPHCHRADLHGHRPDPHGHRTAPHRRHTPPARGGLPTDPHGQGRTARMSSPTWATTEDAVTDRPPAAPGRHQRAWSACRSAYAPPIPR